MQTPRYTTPVHYFRYSSFSGVPINYWIQVMPGISWSHFIWQLAIPDKMNAITQNYYWLLLFTGRTSQAADSIKLEAKLGLVMFRYQSIRAASSSIDATPKTEQEWSAKFHSTVLNDHQTVQEQRPRICGQWKSKMRAKGSNTSSAARQP